MKRDSHTEYVIGTKIRVKNTMQVGYTYVIECKPGNMKDHAKFKPVYTPKQMLKMGVFEGQYLDPRSHEFPQSWFRGKISKNGPDPSLNQFKIKSRQPLSVWLDKGWIDPQDPRGWFEWYCRFWMGRRTADDTRQINRWSSFSRHAGQIKKNCPGDLTKRPRQRQALLQWSYDPFI